MMIDMNTTTTLKLDGTDTSRRTLRTCLGNFGTGVTVITASFDGQMVGVTANSFASLSLDPPLVLWSIGRSSRSFEVFQKANAFAVHFLAHDQIDLSQRFAGKQDDKFDGIEVDVGLGGAPIVTGCMGVMQCSVDARHEGGDHIIMVGRVHEVEYRSAEPLIFVQGGYAVVRPHPALAMEASGSR